MYFASSGVFMIPANALQVIATGTTSGGRKGVLTTSGTPGFGLLNPTTRAIVFAQSFTAGDVTIDIQLVASIDNLMPSVVLQPPSQIECNAIGGSNVAIPALIADVDGSTHTSRWSVDGSFVAANVDTLTTFLPLGSHMVEVVVFDEDGGVGVASANVEIVDTTPPVVSSGVCLWPPNHKRYVVDSSLALDITDVCDPNPTITFVSGTSDQPDNGPGDGNTTDDIVVHPSTVCVRAERDGHVLTGRAYTVVGNIVDASQNSQTFELPIVVPHSHAQFEQCDVFGGEPVDDADPRCIPLPNPLGSSANRPADLDELATRELSTRQDVARGGCNAAEAPCSLLVFFAALALRRRRRR